MSKRVLVSGGAGFIGSHVTVELIQAGYDVVVADDMSNCDMTCFEGVKKITGREDIPFIKMDFCDLEAVNKLFSEFQIDAVIHFAAFKAVGESVAEPVKYYTNNLSSFLNVIEAARTHGGCNVLFSSSATVYGEPDKLPVTEESPRQPATSPYGNTKQICEDILRDSVKAYARYGTEVTPGVHKEGCIKGIALRYFNPIGAHPSALIGELPNGVPNNLIPYVTQTAMGIRKELTIFGNDYDTPDGTCIRDYIYVVDLAKAHVCAMARVLDKETEPIEYFNIGTGKGNSTLEIVETFEKATGVKLNWKYGPRREGDIEKIWGNVDKANKVLGWKAEAKLDDVLASAWKWQVKLREDGVM